MFKPIFFFSLILGLALGAAGLRAEENATLQVPSVTTEKTGISVSDVTVSNISSASATITWNSNAAGDSQIRYSEISAMEVKNIGWQVKESSPEGKTSHTAYVKGLKPNTKYFFEVITANVNLSGSTSGAGSFTTLTEMETEMKPDLIITDIYFSPNTPTSWQQFSGEVKVKVKNQGQGAANAAAGAPGIPVIITIADAQTGNNSDWANAGFAYLDSLTAGAWAEANFPVKYTTFSSDVLRLKAWVDSNSLTGDLTDNLYINETDETNNFYKKDFTLNETAANLLSLELDKVALNSSEIEPGFVLTHLTYNASDVSSANSGIPQPSESIMQSYQSKNINTDRQSFVVGLRTHKTIADARRHFEVINTQHGRQVISLLAEKKETFGDEIFCHTSPDDYTIINRRAGQPDVYYFICGFRYKNIFIDLQAELITNDYKIPLRNLREYFDNIINYDSTRKPPLPVSSSPLPASGSAAVKSVPTANAVPQETTSTINRCVGDYNKPVCGLNGKTYASRCEAEQQNNVKVAYEGKCVTSGTVTPDKVETLILKLERTISALEQKIVELEKKLVAVIDKGLINRIKGRILLQVEENGEAWYVDPESENKLYLKDGQAAYDIMRGLGLGISNANLEKIPLGIQEKLFNLKDSDGDKIPDNTEVAIGSDPAKNDSDGDGFDDKTEILSGYKPNSQEKYLYDTKLTNRLKGRILIQVQSHGEAWYINPADAKRYYLGDQATAYSVMRFLSLGIKNSDLRKIQVGEFEEK